ncbi:MAG: SRPBCC family protein [Dehalococcoidia bacterium]|nr:MAG: SRPBCC family protein [Dehalococcoidia bacterium]
MQNLRELAKAGIATVWAALLSFVPGRRLHNWGGTQEEIQARSRGDELMLDPDVRFIRAITVDRPPSQVWPWVAQIGRGAGYYSYDLLDNGGKPSADHLVDIPPPTVGDRNEAIGKVVHVEPGREIVWQASGMRFLGAAAAMVMDYTVLPHGADSSRVVILILGRVRGWTAWLARWMFEVIDYVMAPQQLRGLKWRVETYADRQKEGAGAPCAGAADHQRDGIAYAGQSESGA